MTNYISAEKLIAEIERRRLSNRRIDTEGYENELLEIIDSLQQERPEVDLEKYIENEINHYGLSLYEASYGTFSASQIDRIIRNAFELGLNARKEK